jgi:hypothetical protein
MCMGFLANSSIVARDKYDRAGYLQNNDLEVTPCLLIDQ